MPRGVPSTRSLEEFELLINVVSRHIHDIECEGRNQGAIRHKRTTAWVSVEKEFNSSKNRGRRATRHELQRIWNNLKRKTKRQRDNVGPNRPLEDLLTAAVERILKENSKTRAPSQSDDGSSTESEQESFKNAGSPRKGVELPTSHNTTVGYCPRREFMSPNPDGQPQSRILSPPILEKQSYGPQYHGQGVIHPGQPQSSGTFQTIANAPPFRPTPIASATPNHSLPAFSVMSPCYYSSYAPTISSMGTSGSLSQPFFRIPSSAATNTHQPVIAPIPQSPLRTEETSRMLLEMQTQIRIRHIQSLAAMEKTLIENKLRTEEMLTNWTKELHEARMQINPTNTPEEKLVMKEMLQKKDNELHLARMRTEEMSANMQKEFYNIKIETAKVEHLLAEVNKGIFELKLQQAEVRLEYFKGNAQLGPTRLGI